MRTESVSAARGVAERFVLAMERSFYAIELDIDHNRFQNILAFLFQQISRGSGRLVSKNNKPALLRRLRNPLLLVLQRGEWIQIVAHDPGKRHMGSRGNQVGKKEYGLAAARQPRAHHVAIVA